MSGKSQRSSAQTTVAPAQATADQSTLGIARQDQLGNAALQSAMPAPTRLIDELRAKVGDALAEAIAEHLSEDELQGHVAPLIDQLVEKAQAAAATDPSHGLSDAQLAEAFAELDSQLDQAARALLDSLDLDGKLGAFVKEYPLLVGAAAIAAAVVWAIKTNPDLPALSKTKSLGGGHSLSGTLDLGNLLDLTLQHIETGWAFDGEKTDAQLKVFGGETDGGWGGEGKLSHQLDAGLLSADGRYFRGDDGVQTAKGGLAFDGKKTDASISGDWRDGGDGLSEWGLGAALRHDGEKTDASLDADFRRENGADRWGLGGTLSHDGTHTDTTLKGRFDRGPDGDTGFLDGRLVNERDGLRRELGGRAQLDGSWSADGKLARTDGDRAWTLGGRAQGDATGEQSATLFGSHRDTHASFSHSLSGEASTDGSWKAQGALTGRDSDNPWSLTGQAGRTSLDPEVDWSITGKYARQLDDQGNTVLSGQQTLGRDMSASRLQLDHSLGGDHSLSAWIERERTDAGTVNGIGGDLRTSIGGAETYARGWAKDNNTWEAAAGISKGTANDDLSFFAEGFTGRNAMGQEDHGARAGLRWRF